MAKISKNEFLLVLRKSGLVEPKRLTKLLEKVEDESAEAVGQQLVRDELATKWQVKFLMSGRNRLDIGSYRLLERIRKDEFGDRFLAEQTSLARKVDIQVLPSALTKDRSNCDRFIQKARLAAQLDHPHLTHVYDIDQEGGRYYLVTEHVGGESLEETDVSQLTAATIAQIISQSIEGLSYAHRHHVIHGCIGPADLVLDAQNQIKVQHLPLSPLRQSPDSEAQPTPKQDFSALARIGSFLLKKGNVSDPSERKQLTDAFSALGTATPDSLSRTTDALADLIERGRPASRSDFGGFDQPIATTSTREKKKPAKAKPDPEPAPQSGRMSRIWHDNPVAVIGTSLVLAVLLIGGSVYGALNLLGNQDSDSARQIGSQSKQSAPSESLKTKQPAPKHNQNPNEPQSSTLPTEDEMNLFLAGIENDQSANRTGTDNQEKSPEQVANAADSAPATQVHAENAAAIASPTDNTPETPNTDPNLNPADPPNVTMTNVVADSNSSQTIESQPVGMPESDSTKPIHMDLTVIRGIADATQAVLQKGGVESLEQIAGMNEVEIRDAIRKGGWSSANKLADYKNWVEQSKSLIGDESPIKSVAMTEDNGPSDLANPGPDPQGPFANFPRTTSLPELENTDEFKIAELVTPRQYLLGAELICEPGAAKGRTTFELNRTEEDKQKWIVGVKKSPKQKSTPIGWFRKSADAFYFQWLPAATEDKHGSKLAPYLRNCFVKLVLPDDQSTILTLREPVKIADLRLTQESLWNEVEIQIPALPAPENIVVEVLPMRIPNVETNIPNSRVERGMPARIWLKQQDKTGFLWIQVAGELRTKLTLRSNLMLLVRGNGQPVPNVQSLQELALSLEGAALQSQRLYDSFTYQSSIMSRTEYDQKKADLLQDTKAKQNLREKMTDYGEALPKILNQPITVRVYAKLGKLQTVLAVTDPTLEQPQK